MEFSPALLANGEHLFFLEDARAETRRRAEAILRTAGGRVLQSYGNRVLVATVPPIAQKRVRELLAPRPRAADEPAPAAAPVQLVETLGIEGWKRRTSPEFRAAKVGRPMAERTWGAAPPDGSPDEFAEQDDGDAESMSRAPMRDLSPYLIGSVAVGLVIVEGPTPDLQFSPEEQVKVVTEVQDGLSWLAQQEPRADVTWTYDLQVLRVPTPADESLPNGYEAREAPWRDAALAALGHPPGITGVHRYVSAIRSSLGTVWGYAAFFTKYPIKHFAYASKPRVVMHYENGDWGPDNIAEVFAHETGHIFGCPDEYRESGCNCEERFGVLDVRNANCEGCAAPFRPCLMARNTRALCGHTRAHLGWRDSNGDGVLDPLDDA